MFLFSQGSLDIGLGLILCAIKNIELFSIKIFPKQKQVLVKTEILLSTFYHRNNCSNKLRQNMSNKIVQAVMKTSRYR